MKTYLQNMSFKNRLLLLVIVFVIFVLTGLVRASNILMGTILDYYVFCVLTLIACFVFKLKFKPSVLLINIIISILLAIFIANLIDHSGNLFNRSFYIFPGALMIPYAILGAITGFFIYRNATRYLGLILFILMSLFFVNYGKWVHDKWFHYVAYSNFGKIKSEEIDFIWNLEYNNTLLTNKHDSLKDTYLVFDFWNSGCVICMREMTIWDSLSQVSSPRSVSIVPVFIPYRDETEENAMAILEKYGIRYVSTAIGNATLLQNFQVSAFPTVLIIKDNVIYFRGGANEALKWLKSENVY